ncbi:MAG: hypothetical protein ACK5JM_05060, partial [Rhodoblastus sp.]
RVVQRPRSVLDVPVALLPEGRNALQGPADAAISIFNPKLGELTHWSIPESTPRRPAFALRRERSERVKRSCLLSKEMRAVTVATSADLRFPFVQTDAGVSLRLLSDL